MHSDPGTLVSVTLDAETQIKAVRDRHVAIGNGSTIVMLHGDAQSLERLAAVVTSLVARKIVGEPDLAAGDHFAYPETETRASLDEVDAILAHGNRVLPGPSRHAVPLDELADAYDRRPNVDDVTR